MTAIFAAFFAWLVIGGWVAAVTERDLIELVAADDELGAGGTIPRPSGSRRRGRIWRIVLLRLAAYVPLALALGYGSLRLVQATYRELTLPSDVVTPIAWRVIATVPEAVIAIVVTWALGETLGSLGARRIVVWGQSLDQAYFGAWADMLRRPLSTHRDIRAADGRDGAARRARSCSRPASPGTSCGPSLLRPPGRTRRSCSCRCSTFVAIWSAGLLVAGLAAAWRSATWTVELVRVRGTFGALRHGPTGEWQRSETSGSLERPA